MTFPAFFSRSSRTGAAIVAGLLAGTGAVLAQDGSEQAQQLQIMKLRVNALQVSSSQQDAKATLQGLLTEMANQANDIATKHRDNLAKQQQIRTLTEKARGDTAELAQVKDRLQAVRNQLDQDEKNVTDQAKELVRRFPLDGPPGPDGPTHLFDANDHAGMAAFEAERDRINGVVADIKQREGQLASSPDAQRKRELLIDISQCTTQAQTLSRETEDPVASIAAFNQDIAKAQALITDMQANTVREHIAKGDAMQNAKHIDKKLHGDSLDRLMPGYDGEQNYSAQPDSVVSANSNYQNAVAGESAAEQKIGDLKSQLAVAKDEATCQNLVKQITALQSAAAGGYIQQKAMMSPLTMKAVVTVSVRISDLTLPPPPPPSP